MDYEHTVITPCLNPGQLLRETVETVVNQRAVVSGRVGLEYLIVDGGSTDGTVEYLETLDHPAIKWTSQHDSGMYDAVAKGLAGARGQIHSYLNAGDLYHPNAFDVVADVMPSCSGWLTGMGVTYNYRGDVIYAATPYRFRRGWFTRGLYDGTVLGFLQQESTFWTKELTATLDLERLATFRLAGDAYLWASFDRHVPLRVVSAHLGGFRLHGDHLGADRNGYRAELAAFTRPAGPARRALAVVDRTVGYMPLRVQRSLNAELTIWRDGGWV